MTRWIPSLPVPDERKERVVPEVQALAPDCVDAAALEDLRQLDASCSLLSTLITHYLEDVPTRLASLQEALLQGDARTVARIAHELNGASGSLGARRMRQLCFDIQALGKAKDLTKAGDLVTQLVSEFGLVRQRLLAEQATIAHDAVVDEA